MTDKAKPYTVEEAERDALAEELDSAPLGHFDAAQVVATAKALATSEARALAAEAQVMVLRDWLSKYGWHHNPALQPSERTCPKGRDATRECNCGLDAALSSPAPSVVRLEEVDALLVDLLNEAQSYVSQHDLPMMRTNFGFRLSLWKQKQGGGQ